MINLQSQAQRTLSYIQAHTWAQSPTKPNETCLMIALVVVGEDDKSYPLAEAIRDDLGITSIVVWNDAAERTVEDVYAVLQRYGAKRA